MHNGMINLGGVKMSKSLGNLVKVSELLTQGHTPDAIRLMLLGTHYREDREFVGRPRSLGADRRPAARSLRGARGPRPAARASLAQCVLERDGRRPRYPTAITVLEEIAHGLEASRLAAETAAPTLLELADVLGLRLGREG